LLIAKGTMGHSHHFENWPFETPINTLALATRHVVEGTLLVLFVVTAQENICIVNLGWASTA